MLHHQSRQRHELLNENDELLGCQAAKLFAANGTEGSCKHAHVFRVPGASFNVDPREHIAAVASRRVTTQPHMGPTTGQPHDFPRRERKGQRTDKRRRRSVSLQDHKADELDRFEELSPHALVVYGRS